MASGGDVAGGEGELQDRKLPADYRDSRRPSLLDLCVCVRG